MGSETREMDLNSKLTMDAAMEHRIACEAFIAYLADLEANDSTNAARHDVDGVEGAYVVEHILAEPHSMKLESLVQRCVETNPKNTLGGLNFTDEKKVAQNSMRRQSQLHTPLRVPPTSMGNLAKVLRPFLNPTASQFNTSPLADDGEEISCYMRLYDYRENEYSSPHFDKPFIETKDGCITRFSAYSVLIYLNDAFDGGETVFYPDSSDTLHCQKVRDKSQSPQTPIKKGIRRTVAGNNLVSPSVDSIDVDPEAETSSTIVKVLPKRGSMLVFPHGRQARCYADPYHSGGIVSNGRKTIIRTDVIYKTSDAAIKARKQKHEQRNCNAQVAATIVE